MSSSRTASKGKGKPTTGRKQRQAAARAAARRRRRLIRVYWAGGALAVAGLLAFSLLSGRQTGVTDPAAFDLPGMGDRAGTRVTLAEFEGTPTVVNFFASWCTACDAELPGFARVSRELEGEVSFVGVATLETGDAMLMPRRHGITWWPLARDINGSNSSGLHDELGGGNTMPITGFYDAEGELVHVQRGAMLEPQLRDVMEQLYGIST